MNYYNEWDKSAAAWLRELIKAGVVPPGDVDERSITEVQPGDLQGYTQCHFFAGILGWSLALQLASWPADRPVWTGSCPCQPFSSAGKHKGAADERHLWPAFFELIRQCRPQSVFGEQVASAIGHGWLDGISADLEREGYAVGAAVLGAHSVGAPHIRQRLFWVGHAVRQGCERKSFRLLGATHQGHWASYNIIPCRDGKSRRVEPSIQPLAHGVPARVGRLRGYGNAIVPQVAAEFVMAYLNLTGD